MKTKLNYLMMLPVVIMTVMMLVPQGMNARQFEYDFKALAENASAANNNSFGIFAITMGANYSISNFQYGTITTFNGYTVDLSRFAFRNNNDGTNNGRGWQLWCQDGTGAGLMFKYTEPRFVITDIRPDDEITITFRGQNNRDAAISFDRGNATQNGNVLSAGNVLASASGGNEGNAIIKATGKGDIIITTTNSGGTIFLTKIVINRPDVASYDYNPTNYEVYDIYYSQEGTTYQTANAGFQLNDYDAVYLNNLSSGLVLNNRVAVSQSYLGTGQWYIKRGVCAQWSWHNISICNLEVGDRVRIYFTGEAVFSSKGNSSTYNGSTAFVDYYNDGIKNNGEFETTDEGDRTITGGTPVAVSASSWHGELDQEFKTSEVYVMEEDGHLDIGLNGTADNGKGSRIVKIEIYSDHPAQMLDKYNGSTNPGYTSYFDVTGQLQGKEHIMPGGLEIQFGNESEEQYAIVTLTDEGPASFVYDQNRYKPARITNDWTKFTVSEAYPAYGTYYKFIPQVSGTMSLKFKANNVNYRNYSVNGNAAADQYGTPNELAVSNVSCPYYLMHQASGNTTPSIYKSDTYNNGGVSDNTFTSISVEKGYTYWLYGWWNSGTTNSNYSSSDHACGVAELIEVTFVPNNMIYPLSKCVRNGTTEVDLATISNQTKYQIKKLSDNIQSCELSKVHVHGNEYTLKANIQYKQGVDQGGVVLIKIGDPTIDDDPVFALTIAYSAGYNNGEGHTWNFTENPLRGLDWSNWNNNSKPEAVVKNFGRADDTNSLLYQEMNEANGHSDWTFNYRVKKGDQLLDPRYLNKYDMVGDNADMMWDTEGLIINTASNQSCIYEDIEGTVAHTSGQSDPDRYIGILPGGEFIIPKLKADDRVIIYMGSGSGSGSNTMHFNITNALDAVHNEIIATDDYYAGGSQWNVDGNNHNDPYYRGCYHFFAKADGDMVFKLVGGSMCKLYSIQIYRGERINTNSVQEVPGNGYLILATEGETGETKSWNLHYRGKGETLANGTGRYEVANEVIANSTNIEDPTITTDGNSISFTNPGSIGMIRVRAKCMEYNHNYVTDFADRNLTLAYHQMADQYPYTWDFTDIHGFSSAAITGENENYNEVGEGYEPRGRELSMWDENGAMVIYCTDGDYYTNQNMIFENSKGINGNQLFANGAVIPETKGLWFYFDNNDPAYNGCMRIAADGLHLANASYENGTTCEPGVSLRRGWWNYKMVLPSVPAGAAVYLRMARDMSVKEGDISFRPWSPTNNAYVNVTEPFFYKKFQFGWMSDKAEIGTDNTDICKYYQASDGTGDYIVAIKNSGETSNLTFTLNGWTLKKMSVATDSKTVNKYGWNTESREHAIDPSLTAFLTGKDFRSYIVTDANREANTVTLARIDGGSGTDGDATSAEMKLIVPGATKVVNGEVVHDNGSKNAYIIRNAGGEAVDIFDTGSGFHLFVPDMHDAESVIPATNLLKAQLSTTANSSMVPRDETITNGEQSTTYNNYAFTYKYKKVDESGNPYTGPQEGEQAFYRIVSGGASSGGHQAYLSIAATPVVPAGARAMAPAYAASQPAEYYSILFQEWNNLDQLKGDVNADGRFNKLDVNTTADYVAGRPAGIFKGLADMNDDGRVDIVDLTLMIRKISGE